MIRRCAALLISGFLLLGSSVVNAQAPLLTGFGGPAGFGVDELPPEDDNSSPPVSLAAVFPSGLEFFGVRYAELFVNTNGNISFAMPLAAFTPMPFPVAAQPIIAPWWADGDTRGAAPATENRVYWHTEPGRFIATWFRVGYFDSHVDIVNSMQLVLTDQSAVGAAGDFDVEFRYNILDWTTGDASDGVDGLGGTPAQAGFDAGNSLDFRVLPGSLTMAVLDLEITSNVGEPGVWRFQVRSGGVTECGNGSRELGEACDDGNTFPGDGCSARCEIELSLGSPCVDDLECFSTFCVAGFCCDGRCDQGCEACTAMGFCDPIPAGTLCRRATDRCDAEELCDGSNGTCPLDIPAPDGADCGNGLACDGDETCLSGACAPGAPPLCDDRDICTIDMCVEPAGCSSSPIAGCGMDAGVDAGAPDAGVDAGLDAGVLDAGVLDAGVLDAGVLDAGVLDAGTDAGLTDASVTDAGLLMDAGSADAGIDAGPDMDAGLDLRSPSGSGIALCGVGAPRRAPGGLWGLGLLAFAWYRRRSRDR